MVKCLKDKKLLYMVVFCLLVFGLVSSTDAFSIGAETHVLTFYWFPEKAPIQYNRYVKKM